MDDQDISGEKRCNHCGILLRPDIEYCADCDACVEGHDHHCGVVGTCVGDPNIKFFI